MCEKKMFGGVGFMLNGSMLVSLWQSSLIVRIGPDWAAAALKRDHVREFDVTGRPMKGWIMVDLDGLESDGQLAELTVLNWPGAFRRIAMSRDLLRWAGSQRALTAPHNFCRERDIRP